MKRGRPLPPGAGTRRRAVPLRLSETEEAPVRAIADAEHGGNLSEALRALIAESLACRERDRGTPCPQRGQSETITTASRRRPAGG